MPKTCCIDSPIPLAFFTALFVCGNALLHASTLSSTLRETYVPPDLLSFLRCTTVVLRSLVLKPAAICCASISPRSCKRDCFSSRTRDIILIDISWNIGVWKHGCDNLDRCDRYSSTIMYVVNEPSYFRRFSSMPQTP